MRVRWQKMPSLVLAAVPLSLLLFGACSDGPEKNAGPPPKTGTTPPTAGAKPTGATAVAPTAAAPTAAPPTAAVAGAAPTAGAVPATPRAVAAPAVATRGTVLEEARKRSLNKEDFTETATNRDPFRSFLASFSTQKVQNLAHPILLEKFSIDELKLAGIVTGEIQPRAMFIDPSGQGVAVVRGAHISKSDALVTRVASDRVYLRIEEDIGQDKPRVTEREIDLHAGELSAQ